MMFNNGLNRRLVIKSILFYLLPFPIYSKRIKNNKTIFIFGSCCNQRKIMSHWKDIITYSPDYLCLLGDNVYGDFFSENAIELKNAYNLLDRNKAFSFLKKNVKIIPIWDDHDYGKNDGDKNWVYKNISKNIFLNFFNIPRNDIRRQRKGIYKSFKISKNKIKVIALDTRYFRDKFKINKNTNFNKKYILDNNKNKTILGEDQWKWFISELSDDYDILIILSSIQVLSEAHGWEKWGNFPHERKKLLDILSRIKAKKIILSGDRHSAGIYFNKENNIYEITSSSFNQNTFNYQEKDNLRIGRLINDNNFGILEITENGIIAKILSGKKSTSIIFNNINI